MMRDEFPYLTRRVWLSKFGENATILQKNVTLFSTLIELTINESYQVFGGFCRGGQ